VTVPNEKRPQHHRRKRIATRQRVFEIGDLHLVLPKTASGEAKHLIQVVAPDGAIIADTATVLKITTDPNANIGASKFAEAHVMDQRAQALGAIAAEGVSRT
jgi:hypothetical protein